MQRITFLALGIIAGLLLTIVPGLREAESQDSRRFNKRPREVQEIPSEFEETFSFEEEFDSTESNQIVDFAPNEPGYLIEKKCWVENLTQNRAILAFERPGVLEYIEPREGDVVEADATIAHLKDDIARAQHNINILNAQNTIDERYAIKAHELAEVIYQRAVETNRLVKDSVPEIEVRQNLLDAQRAELQIEKAQHDQKINELTADESEVQLKTFDLKTPFKGTVIKVYKSKGEAVNQGDPVLEILNIETVRISGWITRDRAHQVKRGDRVLVKLYLDDQESSFNGSETIFEGKIQFVDLKTVGVKGNVQIYADVANQDNLLLPGSAVAMKVLSSP
ncbi:MAG: HlyD family efflux transporter periplasmic adaptor subunit [Planctomycetaceae bacterium]